MPPSTPRFALVFSLWAALLSTGCDRSNITGVGPIEAVERDSIVSTLESAGKEVINSAFEQLGGYNYDRYIRTEQYNDEDFLLAFTEYAVRVQNEGGQRKVDIEQADSAGSFEFGFFKRFVSENVDSVDPVNLVPFVLDEEPSYMNPRNIDKYRFRVLGDTLLWDRQARVIEVRARPDAADGENIRLVRHYIDRETGSIVAMYLERVDLALLFREESSFYVHVRPLESGQMVPYNTRFESLIRTPFRTPYRVRTVSTYSNLTPAE